MQRRSGDSAMSRPFNATKDKMREDDLLPLEKKYIEVQYDAVTQGYLREFCEQNGFDLSIKYDGSKQDPANFDFHTTVWFTTTEHRIPNGGHECNITATPKGWALFGPNQDILVMEIGSKGLLQLRNSYGEQHAMEDEWPDYRPHITVCYRHKGGLPDWEPQDRIEQPLRADRVNVKKQKS